MPRARSTHCRYCGGPGQLFHGAHPACHSAAQHAKKPNRRIPATHCVECLQELPLNRVDRCADCQASIDLQRRRQVTREYKAAKREQRAALRRCRCGCDTPMPKGRGRIYATPECQAKIAAKYVRPARPTQPRVQLKEEKPSAPPPPVEIIVGPIPEITRIPSVFPGLREPIHPDEIDPARAAYIDEKRAEIFGVRV